MCRAFAIKKYAKIGKKYVIFLNKIGCNRCMHTLHRHKNIIFIEKKNITKQYGFYTLIVNKCLYIVCVWIRRLKAFYI